MTMASSDTGTTVLHVGKHFPPDAGGMETYLRDLMVASEERGVRTLALVHHARPSPRSVEEVYPVGATHLTVFRAANWFRFMFTPVSPTFPWLMQRLIQRYRPQVLHLHLPNPSAMWALLLPSARRRPWVIHWQSDVVTPESRWALRLLYWFYAPLESALLRRARKIIVSSPPYLASSRTLAPFRSQCTTIPLGIADRFRQSDTRASTAESAGPLKVLAIGRLTFYKGFDVLLRAIAKTTGIELDLVGDGAHFAQLQQLASSLGINSRVRFHGSVSDEARDSLLQACDCVCLPSTDRAESFGIVLLEAMSASKACVVSDVAGSGMSWLVETEKTGLVVPSNDAPALAAALERLKNNRPLLTDWGLAGRRKFNQALTIDASAQAVVALYRELLHARAAGE